MRNYPDEVTIDNTLYKFERVLKEDFFSINLLYNSENNTRYVLKLSDFRFIFGVFLRPLASFFSRREYNIYQRVADIKGIPALGPRHGGRGYLHLYVDGLTLHEFKGRLGKLPDDFFVRLKAIIEELHNRRIFYLDLNKLGNIIVGSDGLPYLIDFQVSIYFKHHRGVLGYVIDKIFKGLIKEDIYHLYKHKRRFQPELMTPQEIDLAKRTGFNQWYNRIFGHPYRKVKRLIYPSGSNEIIWYKWKKTKDKKQNIP
ncbi:MAG: hypothetical protein HQL03_09375 [Nitrospirae bacterium]|nr:hypothetical protein [Nitrospirota bacterium]MBF0590836.1 hypothetical protein [Nitrospirota bacterium]